MICAFSRTGFDGRSSYYVTGDVPNEMHTWFSSAILQEPGSNISRLVDVILRSARLYENAMVGVLDSRSITDATGTSLDRIGALYNVTRVTGISDERFREQIMYAHTLRIVSGTTDDIRDYVAYLLGMDKSEVVVLERYGSVPIAIISVRLTGNPTKLIPWSAIDTAVMRAKAEGVQYESANYAITQDWIDNESGWGYDSWGDSEWP